jgi:hypothetical protein
MALSQTEEGEDDEHDHDKSDDIDDAVHEELL